MKDDPSKTVILVTHDMSAVRRYCSKAIMIDGGKIVDSGDPDDVADSYSLENISSDPNARRALKEMKKNRDSYIKVEFDSEQVLNPDETLKATVRYKSTTDRPAYVQVSLQVNGVNIMSVDTSKAKGGVTNDRDEHILKYELPLDEFAVGDMRLVASLVDKETKSNVASIGFNDELLVKITSPDVEISGLMQNKGILNVE